MNLKHLLATLDTLTLKEEVSPDDLEGLLQQYKSGEISYDEFKSQLDSLENTDYSMRQGEMGNPDMQDDMRYNRPGGDRKEWDQYDRDEAEDEEEYESVSESVVAECPMEDEEAEESDKPTMNVTMNASNADSIRQLLNVLSGFEGSASEMPTDPGMISSDDAEEGIAGAALGGAAGAALTKTPSGAIAGANIGSDIEDTAFGDDEVEEFVNQPDEKYAPVSAVTASGNDMHRSKDSYSSKPYRGDNPMAELHAQLESLYNEIKSR